MTCSRLKAAVGIAAGILLASWAATTAHSSDGAGDSPSPGEIIKSAQEKYASLTSYSDEGKSIAVLNGTTITHTFTIRLALRIFTGSNGNRTAIQHSPS